MLETGVTIGVLLTYARNNYLREMGCWERRGDICRYEKRGEMAL